MKLSIVVPVFNVGNYVTDFCKSLFPQLIIDVEVIIVNDGSQDDSISLIESYIEHYDCEKFITILHQANAGLSAARNFGTISSRGEYIAFIDPDDFVSNNYIRVLLDNLNSDIDILSFNSIIVDTSNKIVKKLTINNYDSEDYEQIMCETFNGGKWYAWARVYKKEILLKNLFPVGKRFEDLLTIPNLYLLSKKIKSIKNELVFYRVNPTGITKNPKLKDIEDVEEFCHAIDLSKGRYLSLTEFNYHFLLYISSLKTLFYISNDLWGPVKSYKYLLPYIRLNRKISLKNINISRNNFVFLKLIEFYYLKYRFMS
ncbi:glycosyltransferase family 2 protein [Rosenbergiella nectarea]|uniref:glycosyltransferase family 2 protein n=1 Tax=Rosenbergiella nectarea TaxID=988801 RepID=UPI001F4E70DB|nr:glycosyltransferase [Rosenbergiella nectarea]